MTTHTYQPRPFHPHQVQHRLQLQPLQVPDPLSRILHAPNLLVLIDSPSLGVDTSLPNHALLVLLDQSATTAPKRAAEVGADVSVDVVLLACVAAGDGLEAGRKSAGEDDAVGGTLYIRKMGGSVWMMTMTMTRGRRERDLYVPLR